MSVKTIFKTLLGTILAIVFASAALEMWNISIASMQLQYMTRLAARQACVLFTQETYRTGGNEGAIQCSDVLDADGNYYVTGDFYCSNDPDTIWNMIYNSGTFMSYVDDDTELGKLKSMQLLKEAAKEGSASGLSEEEKYLARTYRNNQYTAANLGVPYLDEEIVNRMFQWNLARLLSNCNSSLITEDDLGRTCVNYKGFKCYVDDAVMDNYDYHVYDTNSQQAILKKDYDIDVSKLKNTGLSSDSSKIATVGITYRIPMRYEGITPLRNIYNYIQNRDNKVEGMSDSVPAFTTMTYTKDTFTTKSGGTLGNTAVTPTTGRLNYILVR